MMEDPTEAQAAEPLAEAPVTQEEMASCVGVLQRLAAQLKKDKGTFHQSKPCRDFRKALAPFVDFSSKMRYGGEGMYEYEIKKRLAKEAAGKKNREKQLDANYRNNVLLRQERIRKLHQVQEANDQASLPMIADGPACVNEPTPAEDAQGSDEPPEKRSKTEQPTLNHPRSCYVCKVRFTKL